MARSLVNLTQARASERLLDPFAGTCGILIEACLIGIESVGVEVQTRMVERSNYVTHTRIAASYWEMRSVCPAKCFHGRSRPGYALRKVGQDSAVSKELLLEESLRELFRVSSPADAMVNCGG